MRQIRARRTVVVGATAIVAMVTASCLYSPVASANRSLSNGLVSSSVPKSNTTDSSQALADRLYEAFPNGYTGSWWDAESSTIRLLLLPEFLDAAKASIAKFPQTAFKVEIEASRFSLHAMSDKVHLIAVSALLEGDRTVGIDNKTQQIELSMDAHDSKALAAARQIAAPVPVVWRDGPAARPMSCVKANCLDVPARGGLQDTNGDCTMGLLAVRNGEVGVLVARHCARFNHETQTGGQKYGRVIVESGGSTDTSFSKLVLPYRTNYLPTVYDSASK